MPSSRWCTSAISSRMPRPPLTADSIAALVSPAAPKSWMAFTKSVSNASRQASIRTFSRKGLPT